MIQNQLSLVSLSLNRYDNIRWQYAKEVQKMYSSYHCWSLSLLEDEIAFQQQGQYLKREYKEFQYQNKIACLSQYYQYHRQLPRIFQKDVASIIQNYHEEVRNLQYKFVSRKMKDHPDEEAGFTTREKTHRPVEKVMKNIELSYYNFEKKNIKKSKDNDFKDKNKNQAQTTLTRNKKSLPMLPLYQYQNKNHQKDFHHNLNPTIKILGVKDNNRNSQKSKHRDPSKKVSVNNSNQSPKNLSRTKSKSNLVMTAFGLDQGKRASVKANQKIINIPIESKVKSAQSSLQKAPSTKNMLERKPSQGRNVMRVMVQKKECKKQQGVKGMFKRAVQTKKMIKISR